VRRARPFDGFAVGDAVTILHRGCTPRVEQSLEVAVTAQLEVAERKVLPLREKDEPGSQAIE
jgi:hypothetical protein